MRRLQKGMFNMNDLRSQLEQMQKMGGMQGLMGMMPGMAKMKGKIDQAGLDDSLLKRQIALINSMTKKERANPALLQASRKKRIAAGAGLEVSDLNKLLKQHRQMSDMMKKIGKKRRVGRSQGHARRPGRPKSSRACRSTRANRQWRYGRPAQRHELAQRNGRIGRRFARWPERFGKKEMNHSDMTPGGLL